MSVRTDVVNLNINVNGNVAQNQLNELRKKAADVKSEMEGLKKGTQEYINKKAELVKLNDQMADLKKTIGITALSQKELVAELNKLKSLRGSVVPFSDEYKKLSSSIKDVEKRLYDVKNGVQGFASFMSKIRDEVKQFGVAAAAYLGFQFITSQFRNIINGAGKLSDSLADIRKSTGLSAKGVEDLNTELKKFDTRTTSQALRDLAVDAGKLGIEGKNKILEFIEAGDQINVALGEDLGADAVKDIGKLVDIFRTKEEFGLKDSMLKVGSAINDVGANSSASEGYIVDFLKRMGGIGPAAKIPLPDLIALAGTMDSLGQTSETSTTAIGNTISKLVTDFEGFAKIANVSGEELKKTFNEKGGLAALQQVLEGVKKSGGNFDDLVAKLGDVGIEGSKAKGVFAVLANNLDVLDKQMKVSNDSYEAGISLTNEFNIKNETFGASLDKLSKEFNSLVSSSFVTNFLKGAVNGIASFIQFLKDLPSWLSENRTALIATTTVILAYISAKTKATQSILLNRLATLLETAADKLEAAQKIINTALTRAYAGAKAVLTGQITLATAAQRLWNLALKANPIGIAIALVGALATAISFLVSKSKELTAQQKLQSDIQQRVAESTTQEISRIDLLKNVIENANGSLDNRKKALNALIAINPAYLNGLTLENIKTQEGKNILDKYIASLKTKAELEAKNAVLVENLTKKQKAFATLRSSDATFSGKSDDQLEKWFRDADKNTKGKNTLFGLGSDAKFMGINIPEMVEAFDQIKVLNDDLAKAAIKNVEIVAGSAGQVAGAVATGNTRTIQSIKDQIKSLDEHFETIDVNNQKALNTNRQNRAHLQAELDRLDGKQDKANERAWKKTENQIEKLREEWKKLHAEINNVYSSLPDDPFLKGIRDAEDEAAKSQEKIKNYLRKKIISQEEYTDATVKIEANRHRKIEELAAKHKTTLSDRVDPLAGASKPITTRPQDFSGDSEKLTRDFLAGEELSSITKNGKARLKAKLNILEVEKAQELSNKNLTENEKALIEEKYRQQAKDLTIESFVSQIESIQSYASSILDIASTINNALNNGAERQLAKEKKQNDIKAEQYKKLLNSKLISQKKYDSLIAKQDEELAKKKHDQDVKAFKRQQKLQVLQVLMNGAAAVARIWADVPKVDFGVSTFILTAISVANTAAQLAAIVTQKPPEAAKGGIFKGPSHSQGGMTVYDNRTGKPTVEVEGDEPFMVLSKNTLKNNGPIIKALLDTSLNKNGAPLSPKWQTMAYPKINTSRILPLLASGGVITSKTSTDIGRNEISSGDPETKEILKAILIEQRENRAALNNFNGRLNAVVSLKDFKEKQTLLDKAKAASGINKI